jgi:hypothetical protein
MKNFLNISQINPPKGLHEKILMEIERKKIRSARIRLGFWLVAFSGLFVFLVPITQNIFYKISQSGFSKYLSLILSDWDVLFTYWKEFMLSIIESMPLFEITAVLSIVFILLVLLKLVLKNIKVAFLSNNFLSTKLM